MKRKGLIPLDGRYLRGFTLIELLIVVIIIGILVAMVVPQFAGRTQQARIQRAKSEVYGTLETALGMYEMDFGRYPENFSQLWDKTDPLPGYDPDEYMERWAGPYIKRAKVKEDTILDPWGNPYEFECLDEGRGYWLASSGPDGILDTDDDIVSETESGL